MSNSMDEKGRLADDGVWAEIEQGMFDQEKLHQSLAEANYQIERRDDYLRRALHWLDSDLANRYQFPKDIRNWVNSVKVCIDPDGSGT